MTDDFFVIQLNIADKIYRLRCRRSEEALARKAARQVNDKIKLYGGHFESPDIELKDLLAMVSFQLSMDNLKKEDKEDASPVYKRLDELILEMENYIKSNT